LSEVIIGKAIKKYNIPREKLVILTKCNFPILDDPNGGRFSPELANSRDYINKKGASLKAKLTSGLSRKHIFEAVEASLQRLGTDYVDMLQIHRYDRETPREETMKALHGLSQRDILTVDLVEIGKVRYIGASSMYAYQFLGMQHVAERNGWTKFVSMQNYYNLLYREEEREMLPACLETGVGYSQWHLSLILVSFRGHRLPGAHLLNPSMRPL
jgi:aryl-alcohol dehydrogenase-like predicted oxidoreductase